MPRDGGPRARIGTSGWQYAHWRGRLYPPDLPASRWFAAYAERFDTVEVNNTFYRVPAPEVFTTWRRQAGAGFLYALKFSRFGTHLKHLRDPAGTIGYFLQRCERLGSRLGPILVQLPPRWRSDPARLSAFLRRAPRRHRWAVELRDPSWVSGPVFEVLAEHRAALCLHDRLEQPDEVTADWVYLRYHGPRERERYSRQHLVAQARRVAGFLERGLDVYAYFNNDAGGHAVEDALALRRYLARRLAPAAAR